MYRALMFAAGLSHEAHRARVLVGETKQRALVRPDHLDRELDEMAHILPGMSASLRLLFGSGSFLGDYCRAVDLDGTVSNADREAALNRLAERFPRAPVHEGRLPAVQAALLDEAEQQRRTFPEVLHDVVAAALLLVLKSVPISRDPITGATLLRRKLNAVITEDLLGPAWWRHSGRWQRRRWRPPLETSLKEVGAEPADERTHPLASLETAERSRVAHEICDEMWKCSRGKMRRLIELLRENPDVRNQELAAALGLKSSKRVWDMKRRLATRFAHLYTRYRETM